MTTATQQKSVTRELANFVTQIQFSDLPSSVVEMTKRTFFDNIGCALG